MAKSSASASRLKGLIRIPLGDGTDAVWFVCDQHKIRWRENYHRES
jgi:hypothetical protein